MTGSVELFTNIEITSKTENLHDVRICRTVCTDRHDDDVDAIQNCRMSGSVELFANIDITSKTETCRMSESVELFTNMVPARPQDEGEEAFIQTPDLQEFNGRFAQIALGHQQIRNINGPETSICENVTKILDTPLPGV